MLINITHLEKTIGTNELYSNFSFSIEEDEKIALVGKNGVGKSTLINLISGADTDYSGLIEIKKDCRMVFTLQEHFLDDNVTALDYILKNVPNFLTLQNIIDTYPNFMGNDLNLISAYSEAIDSFSTLEYYAIEDKIIQTLQEFHIDFDKALSSMQTLSGGEKRFVELTKVMYANADIAFIDEPTNHMDYIGKEFFIDWMKKFPKALFIITHDRDVLMEMNNIIELKDKKIQSYRGNYDAYLEQNTLHTITKVKKYEDSLKELEKIHTQMILARVKKLSAKSDSGRMNAKVMEERFKKMYEVLKTSLDKPSFWIDQDSIEKFDKNIITSYEKYKDKSIVISKNKSGEHKQELLRVTNLSIGYSYPLFTPVTFILSHEDRVLLKGRNGAGKSSLVKSIIAKEKEISPIKIYTGHIKKSQKLIIGIYEQEISPKFLTMSLFDALLKTYEDANISINQEGIFKLMGTYLFKPQQDKDILIKNLSGGQKARFQIIRMLACNPNLLILDEPTNHLDLPSVEELEKYLINFPGAILYISHDSYFSSKMNPLVIPIVK